MLLALTGALGCRAFHVNAQNKAVLNFDLTPRLSADPSADAIFVRYTLLGVALQQTKPLELEFETLAPMLLRTKDQVTDLNVSDDHGQLSFAMPVKSEHDGSTFEMWRALRIAAGPVHVSYFVPVALAKTAKRGPQIDLQAAGGGISGAFVSFLCVPNLQGTVQAHVHWNLPKGQSAVSSYATGDFVQDLNRDALRNTLFLAGQLRTYPSPAPVQGLSTFSLGLPPESLERAAQWTSRAFDGERQAFQGSPTAPFRFMIRSYEGGPFASGRAGHASFLLYLPVGMDPGGSGLHDLVAHEMVHGLIEDLDAAPGDEGLWYTEGTADYFKLILPYSAQLYTPREYLDLINQESAEYYTNALITTPNRQLSEVMWSGRNAWTVPYARGTLYFADLSAKLEARHAGVKVVDLVNEVSRHIRSGEPGTNELWRNVLASKAGAWAVEDWQSMLSGKLLMPQPDAFGDCFVGSPKRAGRFDMGFKYPVRLQAGSKIGGVAAGSAAAKAGLRDGDVMIDDIDLIPIYTSFDKAVSIPIRRGEQDITITYNPHMGSVPAMRWAPRSGNPDRPCS